MLLAGISGAGAQDKGLQAIQERAQEIAEIQSEIVTNQTA
jgi:hypothetical protein